MSQDTHTSVSAHSNAPHQPPSGLLHHWPLPHYPRPHIANDFLLDYLNLNDKDTMLTIID